MRSFGSLTLVGFLIILGLLIFFYKYTELKFPLTPSEQYDSWYIEARLSFKPDWSYQGDLEDPTDRPVRVEMLLPRTQENLALIEEQFIADGYGIEVEKNGIDNRQALLTKRKGDRKELIYYRAIFYRLDSSEETTIPREKPRADSPFQKKKRPNYIEGAEADPLLQAIDGIIDEAGERAADKRSLIKALALEVLEQDERDKLIMARVAEAKTQASLMVLLLNTANIPARLVHGLTLDSESQNLVFHDWPEVWYADKWRPVDMETQRIGFDTPHLTWWIGNDAPFKLEGGRAPDLKLSVKKNTDNALQRAIWKSGESASMLQKFSLFNLPIGTQILFQVMLMIPLGGLIIAFLRQIVGIKTFGTFMPVLVALAFRETGLEAGVAIFVLIVVLGLIIRGWFDKLQLLMVPRLASVLTIVVLLICGIAVMAQNLGVTVGLSLSLFPIVILTMTIERMSLMWEESGPHEATVVGLSSLFAAVIAYFVLTNEHLMHLVFTFPELLLVVLALNILMGRYNGYKLSEYFRFKALHKRIIDFEKQKAK
jgi:hypothetical protein